jgi:hypothetical protein
VRANPSSSCASADEQGDRAAETTIGKVRREQRAADVAQATTTRAVHDQHRPARECLARTHRRTLVTRHSVGAFGAHRSGSRDGTRQTRSATARQLTASVSTQLRNLLRSRLRIEPPLGNPSKYLLTNLAQCGVCGSPLRVCTRSHGTTRARFIRLLWLSRPWRTVCANKMDPDGGGRWDRARRVARRRHERSWV